MWKNKVTLLELLAKEGDKDPKSGAGDRPKEPNILANLANRSSFSLPKQNISQPLISLKL